MFFTIKGKRYELPAVVDRTVGPVMRQSLGLGLGAARRRRRWLIIKSKASATRTKDIVTNADLAAQAAIVAHLRRTFKRFGVIAEEDRFRLECQLAPAALDYELFFVVDGIEGTKRFAAGEHRGWGSQVALIAVRGDEYTVLAAYIIDGATGEIVGYDPFSSGVHSYLPRRRQPIPMTGPDPLLPLSEQWVVCRGNPIGYTRLFVAMLSPPRLGGLFARLEAPAGSPALAAFTVFRGNAGGLVLPSRSDTEIWDQAPLAGIMQALGLVRVKAAHAHGQYFFEPCNLPETVEPFSRPWPVLYIRPEHLDELNLWADRQRS